MNRVAITGVGAISCLGNSRAEITDSLYNGRSGIVSCPERKEYGFRSSLTGRIKELDPSDLPARKARKTMTEHTVQAYVAVKQAIAEAGLAESDLQNDMTGLVFGCDSSAVDCFEQASIVKDKKNTGALGSGYIFKSMTSNITMNLNVMLQCKGACWTISSACSSGGHAIGQASDLIRTGRQDIVICGGAQELNWQSICGFDSLDAFSTSEDSPETASRPFSKDRNGLVPSGGAAVVILENFDNAVKRGANIIGEVIGYGFSSDGMNISVPDSDGLFRAMKMAVRTANIDIADVDYICAHATSTPLGDNSEAKAIADLFGDNSVKVSSLKAMCGHELWMAGASQVVYSAYMAAGGFTSANINFSGPDEESARLNILTDRDNVPPGMVVCNSAGFGGTNSSLIIKYAV